MKLASLAAWLLFSAAPFLRADLTLVQKVEGAGPASQMTMKVKGNKARIDVSPKVTSLIDGATGDTITLMHENKMVVRISADKIKAAAEMVEKFDGKKKEEEKEAEKQPAKLTPTGKKQTIDGFETEEYVYDGPSFKASYWISTKYPDTANILKQLQLLSSKAWQTEMKVPDYGEFPGLPLKTELTINGSQRITTTVVSVKQDPLPDSDFAVPAGYRDMSDFSGLRIDKGSKSSPAASPDND